jgi:hypothetical protein
LSRKDAEKKAHPEHIAAGLFGLLVLREGT